MTEPNQPTQPEESPIPGESVAPAPAEETQPNLASARIRGPLPSSPVERAKLEAQGQIAQRSAEGDRSTMVAFGLLFIVPILIILLSLVLLFPFINAQINREPDPGGADTQSLSKGQTPSR